MSARYALAGLLSLFLFGYLNSALATYFMKRIVNTTATADIGYLEKLPYRRPPAEIEAAVADMFAMGLTIRDDTSQPPNSGKATHGRGGAAPLSRGRNSTAVRAGLSVSELKAEITVEMAIVTANWR